MQCQSCQWWYHLSCAGYQHSTPTTFICELCMPSDEPCPRRLQMPPQGRPPRTQTQPQRPEAPPPRTQTQPQRPETPPPRTPPQRPTMLQQSPHNPFIAVTYNRRIKICRGCKKCFDISVVAPNNLVLKHWESYSFFNKRSQAMQDTSGNRYYHANLACLRLHQYDKDRLEGIQNLSEAQIYVLRRANLL